VTEVLDPTRLLEPGLTQGAVGRSLPLEGAEPMVTGSLKYLTDLQMPGMLFGGIYRAQLAHGRLQSLDITRATALAGVVAVLTARDVPRNELENGVVLVEQHVRQFGDPVALVVAETPELVEEGIASIRAEFEGLPVVSSAMDALSSSTILYDSGNVLEEIEAGPGDAVLRRLTEVPVVVERFSRTPSQEHVCLEPGGGVAILDSGRYTIWYGTQHPGPNRRQVAHAMKVRPEDVRIISTPMGGSFGSKGSGQFPTHLALMARATGRPVKMVMSREEVFIVGPKRHASSCRARLGVSQEGKFIALDMDLVLDTGPYASNGRHVMGVAAELCTGPYRFEAVHFRGRVVHTNNANSGAFRGYGAPQVAFALETAIDEAAERLGIGPADLRRRNCLRPGEQHSLYHHRVDLSLRAAEVLEAVASHPWWSQRDEWALGAVAPWARGTGLALAMKGVGIGSRRGDVARARLEIPEDLGIVIFAGPNHSGQWIQTAYQQIAAETLGIPFSVLRVIVGDTDSVPESGGCNGSRSTLAGGSAVQAVCGQVLGRLKELGFTHPIDWGEALSALRKEGPVVFEEEFALPEVAADPSVSEALVQRHALHAIYSSSAQVARVEVNRLTGEWRVASVLCAVDCGRAINPAAVEGQAEGGVVQSVGFAQMEDHKVDQGIPVTTSLETYLIPTAVDAPEVLTLCVESGRHDTAFGAKGMAEVVCVPTAPAIVAAICDAVGVRPTELPVTAERLYNLLHGTGQLSGLEGTVR
jgi:CO/xanthine dehydrogenase Mo-binding subunit